MIFLVGKSIWILINIKKLENFRKSARKCAPNDLFTFASDDVIPGKQTREQAIGVLSETLHYTTLHYTTVVTSKMSVLLICYTNWFILQ